MPSKSTAFRYTGLSIALHWLTLALLAGVYACIELRSNFPKGSDARELLKHWHFMLGLTVFAVTWLRLLVRLRNPAPPILPPPPMWQMIPARLVHLALYALLLGAPLAGWLILSAGGKPIPFYGLELPALIGKNPELASQIKHWHELAGVTGYWLIGLHALAALLHHYVIRDNTLTRMLPGR